jgi:hypothetical protein
MLYGEERHAMEEQDPHDQAFDPSTHVLVNHHEEKHC